MATTLLDTILQPGSLTPMFQCQTEFLKVDGYLVRRCHADKLRVAALESLVALARTLDSQVIAEGVEEWAGLETLLSWGIGLVQGFMLSRPMRLQTLLKSGPSFEQAAATV